MLLFCTLLFIMVLFYTSVLKFLIIIISIIVDYSMDEISLIFLHNRYICLRRKGMMHWRHCVSLPRTWRCGFSGCWRRQTDGLFQPAVVCVGIGRNEPRRHGWVQHSCTSHQSVRPTGNSHRQTLRLLQRTSTVNCLSWSQCFKLSCNI